MRALVIIGIVLFSSEVFAQLNSVNYQSNQNGNVTSGNIVESTNYKSKALIKWNEGLIQTSTNYKNSPIVCIQKDTQSASIFDAPSLTELNVYPNPFSSIIYIDMLSSELLGIKVMDLKGAVVYQNDNMLSSSVDLKSIESGMYYLYIYTKTTTSTQKIVKIAN